VGGKLKSRGGREGRTRRPGGGRVERKREKEKGLKAGKKKLPETSELKRPGQR